MVGSSSHGYVWLVLHHMSMCGWFFITRVCVVGSSSHGYVWLVLHHMGMYGWFFSTGLDNSGHTNNVTTCTPQNMCTHTCAHTTYLQHPNVMICHHRTPPTSLLSTSSVGTTNSATRCNTSFTLFSIYCPPVLVYSLATLWPFTKQAVWMHLHSW